MATSTSNARTVPTALESAQSKLVYVYLQRERETTIDALAEALDMRKLGLFTVLSKLEGEDFVERDGAHVVRFAG